MIVLTYPVNRTQVREAISPLNPRKGFQGMGLKEAFALSEAHPPQRSVQCPSVSVARRAKSTRISVRWTWRDSPFFFAPENLMHGTGACTVASLKV